MSIREKWEMFSPDEQDKIKKEYNDIIKWYKDEEEKLEKRLKSEKKWKTKGLDSNQKNFSELIKERQRRFFALKEKYNLK